MLRCRGRKLTMIRKNGGCCGWGRPKIGTRGEVCRGEEEGDKGRGLQTLRGFASGCLSACKRHRGTCVTPSISHLHHLHVETVENFEHRGGMGWECQTNESQIWKTPLCGGGHSPSLRSTQACAPGHCLQKANHDQATRPDAHRQWAWGKIYVNDTMQKNGKLKTGKLPGTQLNNLIWIPKLWSNV